MNKFKAGDTVKHITGKPFRGGYGVEVKITKYNEQGQCYMVGRYGYNEKSLVLVENPAKEKQYCF